MTEKTNAVKALQILEWYGYHNSNLTKEQYHKLDELTEAVRAIRNKELQDKTTERIKDMMHRTFILAWLEARRTAGQRLTNAEQNEMEQNVLNYVLGTRNMVPDTKAEPEPQRTYTKGDCYALCEFLEALTLHNSDAVTDIAEVLGYAGDTMRDLLARLAHDIDQVICDEQEQQDYTEQMADIMELKHIEGGNND